MVERNDMTGQYPKPPRSKADTGAAYRNPLAPSDIAEVGTVPISYSREVRVACATVKGRRSVLISMFEADAHDEFRIIHSKSVFYSPDQGEFLASLITRAVDQLKTEGTDR